MKKSINNKKLIKVICGIAVALIIVLGIVIAITTNIVINMANPNLRYDKKLAKLKANHSGCEFFPDNLPENAKEININTLPTILQGSGYEYLSFYTDDAYIDGVIKAYGENARIGISVNTNGGQGTYDWYAVSPMDKAFPMDDTTDNGYDGGHEFNCNKQYAKNIEYIEKGPVSYGLDGYQYISIKDVPGFNTSGDDQYSDLVFYILTDNDNWNHHHIKGFYVIRSIGKIAFFEE